MRYFLSYILLTISFAAHAEPATQQDIYDTVAPLLPDGVTQVSVCIEDACQSFEHCTIRKGGQPETMKKPHDFGGTVGDIVGAVGSKVGDGGRISVTYEKRNADGSYEKATVEVSAGVGSAAAPAAAPSK